MNNFTLLKIFSVFIACFFLNALHAQYEDYAPYENTYQDRLREFDNNLQEARDYFQNQDDQGRIARTHKKIDEGLQGFLETEFMNKFKDFRLETESLAASFKAYSETLRPEQVVKVRKAYIKIADQANLLLNDIKKDFLDNKKLKHIRQYPDMYSAALELRLRNLQEEYSDDFQKVIAEITGSDQYSATPLLAIFGIIKFTIDFTNYLSRVRYENRRVKAEHLDAYFIEPFRFRSWEEIETITADIYKDDSNSNEPAYDQNPDPDEPYSQPAASGTINPFVEDEHSLPAPQNKKGNN